MIFQKNRNKLIEKAWGFEQDIRIEQIFEYACCHSSFWKGKRKATELKFCQYVCIRGRFQEI